LNWPRLVADATPGRRDAQGDLTNLPAARELRALLDLKDRANYDFFKCQRIPAR
jgi:hypothetical protein